MKLRHGASKCMVASLILGQFAAHLMVGIMGHFMVYLLDDRHDIHDQDAARVIGNMGTVSEIFAISTQLALGALMDLYGRKIWSVGGLALATLGTLMSPVPTNLPALYVCRVITNVGTLPFMWSPYSVDYIMKESLGLFAAYMSLN